MRASCAYQTCSGLIATSSAASHAAVPGEADSRPSLMTSGTASTLNTSEKKRTAKSPSPATAIQ
jgi:hypothetical protein